MTLAILFPGQGSQFVGMSEDVFEARPDLLVDRADDILGWSMRRICADGPAELVTDTRHAQPILFAVAYAMWEEISASLPTPAYMAGHSLGEYTALAAAGAVSFDDGLRLVAARGAAMAEAAASDQTGMAALLGADVRQAQAIVDACNAAGGTAALANLNSPSEIVVAGTHSDLEWIQEHGGELGARRVIPLKVAGAFHTPFMQAAVEPLRAALEGVDFRDPAVPVIGNTDGVPLVRDELVSTLTRQVVEPVRFADGLRLMADRGVDTFVHVGPGTVTAGMAKRTVPTAHTEAISHLVDVADVAERLRNLR